MALTLAESAKLCQDDLQRGVIETFVQESPILDRLPMIDVQGNAYAYNEELTLPGVAFRAVNTAYVESTGTVNPKTESLKILGGDADLDRFIVQTRGNLNDQRAVQARLKVKAAVYSYHDTFFNGSVGTDVNSFDGLKTRLTGGQVITAGTNGLAVLGADDNARHAFLDKLDEAISVVANPGAIYCNRAILFKIKSSARRLGKWAQTITDFGKTIDYYDGIPLLDAGTKSDGTTNVLPQTETQGTAAGICSSIYVVGFSQGEDEIGVAGLTNGGVMVDDLGMVSDKPVYRTRIEFYCGMAAFGGRAASRLGGVLNS